MGFRYSFYSQAQRLNLTGWVKNCRDGSVEAMVQGIENDVAAVVSWVQDGPGVSNVDRVEVWDRNENFSHFEIHS